METTAPPKTHREHCCEAVDLAASLVDGANVSDKQIAIACELAHMDRAEFDRNVDTLRERKATAEGFDPVDPDVEAKRLIDEREAMIAERDECRKRAVDLGHRIAANGSAQSQLRQRAAKAWADHEATMRKTGHPSDWRKLHCHGV